MTEHYVKLSDVLRVLRIYSSGEFEQRMKALPTKDVRENVHGEWIHHRNDLYGDYCECHACHAEFNGIVHYKFCTNCGAQMDGGDDK